MENSQLNDDYLAKRQLKRGTAGCIISWLGVFM